MSNMAVHTISTRLLKVLTNGRRQADMAKITDDFRSSANTPNGAVMSRNTGIAILQSSGHVTSCTWRRGARCRRHSQQTVMLALLLIGTGHNNMDVY